MNADDIRRMIRAQRDGRYGIGTVVSKKLLNALDHSSRALPHTNQASLQAQHMYESMMHKFGLPHIFLTVAFDDEASFLLQVLSGVMIDTGEDVGSLCNEELVKRANK